jgi:hypothetical protein
MLWGQNMPCYRISADRFYFLSLKPENSSFIEYDFNTVPKGAKEVKIYYSILVDSLTTWVDSSNVRLAASKNLDYQGRPVIQINYNEKGEPTKLVFIKAKCFNTFSRKDLLSSQRRSHLHIIEEKVEATLSLIERNTRNEEWRFIFKDDTTFIQIRKMGDKFMYTNSYDTKRRKGRLNYIDSDSIVYDNYSELINRVIIDKEKLKKSPLLKEKFVRNCKKDIYFKDGRVSSIFYMDVTRYSLVNFVHDVSGNLKYLENEEYIKGEWRITDEHKVSYVSFNKEGSWTKRSSLFNWGLGTDFRFIKYY